MCMSQSLYKGRSVVGFSEFEGPHDLDWPQFGSPLGSPLSPAEEASSLYLSQYFSYIFLLYVSPLL